MHIRDRIKELRRVPAGALRANPRNWRTHPEAQRDALRGMLAEIGFAAALVARELEDGTLELVDGHLRAETAPEALLPVLVLDVSEEEAAKLLLTLDPLAALAGTDQAQLADLLATTEFADPQLDALLTGLVEAAEATLEDTAERAEVAIPESFQVVVQCESEADQQAIYERMRQDGYRCRVLTL
jgi:ParB-like chromosome segregation protein Spo0J